MNTLHNLVSYTDFAKQDHRRMVAEAEKSRKTDRTLPSCMVREFQRMNVTRTSPIWYVNSHGKLAVNI